MLLEVFKELDVVFVNFGTSYIFRGRGLESMVDLTYVSAAFTSTVAWKVGESVLIMTTRQYLWKSRANRVQ